LVLWLCNLNKGEIKMETVKYELSVELNELKALKLFSPKKEIRYYLNGIYIEFNKKQVILAATDGHKLLCCAKPNNESQYNLDITSAIIPIDAIESILKIKSPISSVLISLDVENNIVKKIHISNGYDVTLQSLPIDGKYPDFRRVFPESVSNEPGNYDFTYLADFNKVAEYLSGVKSKKALLGQNGTNAGLVDVGLRNWSGVIMPMVNVKPLIFNKPKFLSNETVELLKEAA